MTATALSVAVISFCYASEHPRRFPVELQVFAANANVLLKPAISERYKQGLRIRMAGSLGSLRFLAREYLQTSHQPQSNTGLLSGIAHLRRLFRHAHWQALARQSRQLAKRYPFDMSGLEPRDAGAQAVLSGKHIYRHLCMGCHEHPDTTQAVPAPDLFSMATTEPTRELIARLIAGVHGTPAVALRNPFSDREIAGLAAYLRQAAQQQH
jgi:mono/diheme cytochrome c family protein